MDKRENRIISLSALALAGLISLVLIAGLGFKTRSAEAASALAALSNGTPRGLLPQGKVEENRRVLNMVTQMDAEGFGNCTNIASCELSRRDNE